MGPFLVPRLIPYTKNKKTRDPSWENFPGSHILILASFVATDFKPHYFPQVITADQVDALCSAPTPILYFSQKYLPACGHARRMDDTIIMIDSSAKIPTWLVADVFLTTSVRSGTVFHWKRKLRCRSTGKQTVNPNEKMDCFRKTSALLMRLAEK